jgi:hypothetical protein
LVGPDAQSAALARRDAAERAAHRLLLEVDRFRQAGITSRQALARALTESGVPTPQGSETWSHTTVARLLARTDTQTTQAADPFPLPAKRPMVAESGMADQGTSQGKADIDASRGVGRVPHPKLTLVLKIGIRSDLKALRSKAGDAMVPQGNYFIEEILPNPILRDPPTMRWPGSFSPNFSSSRSLAWDMMVVRANYELCHIAQRINCHHYEDHALE